MIISKSKKFIFIHNPKVAGSSIRAALSEYDSFDNFFWHRGYISGIDHAVDKPHITMNDLSKTEYYQYVNNNDFFVFGFVRNPYERVYSAYQERIRQWGETRGFNDFLKDLNDINIRYDYNFIHFCPQHYFFYNGKKCIADFIGKMESINEDYFIIQSILDIEGLELPKNNVTEKIVNQNYLSFYDDESIKIVNALYEKDFLLFNYNMLSSFELNMQGIEQGIAFPDKYSRSPINSLLVKNQQLQEASKQLQEANEQVQEQRQEASEQLQETSEQLQETSEQLQETNEQLQEASEQLQETSEQLQETSEQLQEAKEQLQETNEQLQEKIHQQKKENEQLNRELGLILNSKAWKLILTYRKLLT